MNNWIKIMRFENQSFENYLRIVKIFCNLIDREINKQKGNMVIEGMSS